MSKKIKLKTGGIGFSGLLTLLFIGLKLTGYITWSWWWVLAPTWIWLVVLILILVFVGAVTLLDEEEED